MSKFYSPSVRGFFDLEIHGKKIPKDAVEITDEKWMELLDANSKGMDIVPDENGFPSSQPHRMTEEQRKRSLPFRRAVALRRASELIDRYRDESDLGLTHTMTADEYKSLVSYRASVREAVELPEMPEVLKAQLKG